MKRRQFIQSVGFDGIGFGLAMPQSIRASGLPESGVESGMALEWFEFDALTVNASGRVKHRETRTTSFFRESFFVEQGLGIKP